jgi:uncharacterized protein YaaW (UPF0174 family)
MRNRINKKKREQEERERKTALKWVNQQPTAAQEQKQRGLERAKQLEEQEREQKRIRLEREQELIRQAEQEQQRLKEQEQQRLKQIQEEKQQLMKNENIAALITVLDRMDNETRVNLFKALGITGYGGLYQFENDKKIINALSKHNFKYGKHVTAENVLNFVDKIKKKKK